MNGHKLLPSALLSEIEDVLTEHQQAGSARESVRCACGEDLRLRDAQFPRELMAEHQMHKLAGAGLFREPTLPAAPADGAWVEVDADAVKDGDRVQGLGTAGVAYVWANRVYCLPAAGMTLDLARWSVRINSGARVEVWQPAEVTLPLPTAPGPFWGRVDRGGDTYTGWIVFDAPMRQFFTLAPVNGRAWHDAEHVTRLPVPDDVKAALL